MKKSYYGLIALTFATMFIGLMISCGSGDGVTVEDGEIKGQATLPLLPIDIPIFPTDVTLDGLVDSIQSELDDQDIPDWLQPSEGAIQDFSTMSRKSCATPRSKSCSRACCRWRSTSRSPIRCATT